MKKAAFSNRFSLIGLFLLLLMSTSSFAQDLWSDPVTWGGTKPIAGDAVTIPMGTHILLDENTPDLAGLMIHGTLEFANQNLQLTADWIMVMGTLQVGTESTPYTAQATITLNATDMTENVMGAMGTRGIMVMGGTLELHGAPPAQTWTKLNDNADIGSTNLTLADAVSWNVNDEIIIAPTDYYGVLGGASVTQQVNVVALSGTQLTIDAGLNAHRWGLLQYGTLTGMSLSNANVLTPPTDPTPTVLDERAPIANLTRNIVIQAPDDALWNNDGFGCHLMIMRMGNTGTAGVAHVDGVTFRRAGQRGNLGRYPFHWHMLSYYDTNELGDASGQYIRNSVVHESMNRGIVIHGTNAVTVENNVVYNVRGHGIFTEDASERRNTVDGNVVLYVRDPDAGFALKNHEASVVNAGRGSSGFWISNPDNTIINNVAGDCSTNGFWLAFPFQTFGLSANIDIRPDRLQFGVFDNNTAFSNRAEGIMLDNVEQDEAGNTFPSQYMSTSDGIDPVWPFDNLLRFEVTACKVWKNAAHGFWDRSVWPDTEEFVSADNCGRFFAGSGTDGVIERCLVIGTSLNHLMNGGDRPNYSGEVTPVAFATYHSAFDIRENVIINFSEVAETSSGAFATDDYYLRPVDKGQIRNTDNMIINAHPGVKVEAEFSYFELAGALWDPHGVWGSTPGDYLVYDDPFFTAGQTPTPVPPSAISGGVLVEGPFYGFNDFVVNDGNIRWEDYMALHVERLDDDFNILGTVVVDEADPNWGLAHMRHFPTHPSDYYALSFPSFPEVYDIGLSVTNMASTDDYQVLAIEYSGTHTVDQIYTSADFHYFNQQNNGAGTFKNEYQPVGCLQDVIDAPTGEVYWQDAANNLVWMKIRGGVNQHFNPADYPAHSDELLYWQFYLRVLGSPGAPVLPDLFLSDSRIAVLYSPTDNLFELQGLLSNYTIEVLDGNEAVIQTLSPSGTDLVIDPLNYPAGLHFVRVEHTSDSDLSVQRILKE